jgi:hypothetical protein
VCYFHARRWVETLRATHKGLAIEIPRIRSFGAAAEIKLPAADMRGVFSTGVKIPVENFWTQPSEIVDFTANSYSVS